MKWDFKDRSNSCTCGRVYLSSSSFHCRSSSLQNLCKNLIFQVVDLQCDFFFLFTQGFRISTNVAHVPWLTSEPVPENNLGRRF